MFFCLSSPAHRHMVEIQVLQTRQKEEIEALFTRMGKPPPSSVFSPAVAMAGGRRRRKSHKSARSSGQPSPIHSGKEDGILAYQFLALNTDLILTLMSILQFVIYVHVSSLKLFKLYVFWVNVYTPLCPYVQDPQPLLRVFKVRSRLQSKVYR